MTDHDDATVDERGADGALELPPPADAVGDVRQALAEQVAQRPTRAHQLRSRLAQRDSRAHAGLATLVNAIAATGLLR